MKFRRPSILTISLVAVLTGCASPRASAATPAKSSPSEKLSEARTIYQQRGDPHKAEALIFEAMAAFAADHDQKGVADANQRYAYFLQSEAVEKEKASYEKDGFLDKSITWKNRLPKAIEYFDKAAPTYAKIKRYDRLTDNNLGRGIVFIILQNKDEACASFDQAASFHEESLRTNPEAKVSVPKEFKSWEAYQSSLKKWAACGG